MACGKVAGDFRSKGVQGLALRDVEGMLLVSGTMGLDAAS
jgi:hypothetical protein